MKKNILLLIFIALSTQGFTQIRSMLDLPSVYLTSKDIENIPSREGLGLDIGYAIGTHYFMGKVSGGFEVTAQVDHEEIVKSILYNPFGKVEIGVGKWRSNGQKCAKTNQNAYTFLAKAGVRYDFGSREANAEHNIVAIEKGMDYFAGAEFGYFLLRDMRRNSEFFINAGYLMQSERIYADLGIRTFINTKAPRR